MRWSGRVHSSAAYGGLPISRRRIYHGTWGMPPFQSIYQPAPGLLAALPLLPEWLVLTAMAFGAGLLGLL